MRRFLCFAFLVIGLLFSCFSSFAQERSVSGRVTGEDGKGLQGVTVTVKNADRRTTTDASGSFTIIAKPGDVLQFTMVGRKPTEITLQNQTNLELELSTRSDVMTEVVVTAMDIRRNPKELGYSTQSVKGAEIAETQRENFINSLQGRISGATITPTSGIAGSSSQIVLRGFN
jgi:hypothetical protein